MRDLLKPPPTDLTPDEQDWLLTRALHIVPDQGPPWVPVHSTNVHALAWLPDLPDRDGIPSGWLFVRFRSGHTWAYAGVPGCLATQLAQAASVGRAFHRHIRDRYVGVGLPHPVPPREEGDTP